MQITQVCKEILDIKTSNYITKNLHQPKPPDSHKEPPSDKHEMGDTNCTHSLDNKSHAWSKDLRSNPNTQTCHASGSPLSRMHLWLSKIHDICLTLKKIPSKTKKTQGTINNILKVVTYSNNLEKEDTSATDGVGGINYLNTRPSYCSLPHNMLDTPTCYECLRAAHLFPTPLSSPDSPSPFPSPSSAPEGISSTFAESPPSKDNNIGSKEKTAVSDEYKWSKWDSV